MELFELCALALLPTFLSTLLAFTYGMKVKDFAWSKYFIFMTGPVISMGVWAYYYDIKIAYLFGASALTGMILEFLLGFAYQRIFQRKLWEYDAKAYALFGHTSLLTLPMWGTAGVIFWITAQFVGI